MLPRLSRPTSPPLLREDEVEEDSEKVDGEEEENKLDSALVGVKRFVGLFLLIERSAADVRRVAVPSTITRAVEEKEEEEEEVEVSLPDDRGGYETPTIDI